MGIIKKYIKRSEQCCRDCDDLSSNYESGLARLKELNSLYDTYYTDEIAALLNKGRPAEKLDEKYRLLKEWEKKPVIIPATSDNGKFQKIVGKLEIVLKPLAGKLTDLGYKKGLGVRKWVARLTRYRLG